jgi:hypothetical protein
MTTDPFNLLFNSSNLLTIPPVKAPLHQHARNNRVQIASTSSESLQSGSLNIGKSHWLIFGMEQATRQKRMPQKQIETGTNGFWMIETRELSVRKKCLNSKQWPPSITMYIYRQPTCQANLNLFCTNLASIPSEYSFIVRHKNMQASNFQYVKLTI